MVCIEFVFRGFFVFWMRVFGFFVVFGVAVGLHEDSFFELLGKVFCLVNFVDRNRFGKRCVCSTVAVLAGYRLICFVVFVSRTRLPAIT